MNMSSVCAVAINHRIYIINIIWSHKNLIYCILQNYERTVILNKGQWNWSDIFCTVYRLLSWSFFLRNHVIIDSMYTQCRPVVLLRLLIFFIVLWLKIDFLHCQWKHFWLFLHYFYIIRHIPSCCLFL